MRPRTPIRRAHLAHVCRTCGNQYVAGTKSPFCTPACAEEWQRRTLTRYRCIRCNSKLLPQLFRWVRVSPTHEAPLCTTDECVIAWRPRGGWPDPTTRRLRKEREYEPVLLIEAFPRQDTLTAEIITLAKHGRVVSPEGIYEVVSAAVRLVGNATSANLPGSPFRTIPAFDLLDLARALRLSLGLVVQGSLDHHLLTCPVCGSHDGRRMKHCHTGRMLWVAEHSFWLDN